MPRRTPSLLACLAIAAGGLIAGCGSDDDEGAGTSSPPPASAPEATGPDTGSTGGEVKVTMKDIEYVPKAITAKVGQKIVWENTDGEIPHTVTATDGADFDSGNMTSGETFEYTPTKAGKIDYVCTIHANQKGSVTVQ